MARTVRVAGVAATALLLVATGCSSSTPSTTDQTPKPTPITRLNADALRLARTSFCTRLPEAAVSDAVGGNPGRGTSWRNGDKAEVEDGVDDVVHEFGCRWSRGDQVAKAWVFARPLSTDQASALVAKTSKRSGCTSVAGPRFGSPSQRQTCTLDDGGRRVRVAGLFDGTWLSCELSAGSTTSASTLDRRTDAWCVQVANALNTTR